jgi:hypothetical protein
MTVDPVSIALIFLKKWWKEILLALVVIGAIWYVRNLQNTVEEQRTTISQMNLVNQTLTASNKTLTSTVTANNKTIEELSKGADQTRREFEKLSIQVEHQSTVLSKRLKDLLGRPVPVTCDDTIKYLIEVAPSFRQ